MKKIVSVLLLIFTAGPLVWAASNCVSRVDKNLDKTTAEKVQYCLTEDPEEEPTTEKDEVILTDVYSVKYPRRKNAPAANQPQERTIKVYSTAPVEMAYTDQKKYPRFRNDIMPTLSTEEANETALQALQEQRDDKSVSKAKAKAKPAKKPARRPKAKPVAKVQAPTQADSQQVRQAQALQNDPLATNPTQDNTVPADFLDDSVMGPSGFGYNATDPAMQP